MWHGELVKVWVKMVLDVVRFWERGCHPIDFGNRGLVNNLMYTCTSVQHCWSQWLKNNSFTKPLKLLVAKLHSSFEMLSKKKNRSAYIWKFFDRSHDRNNFNDLFSMINTRIPRTVSVCNRPWEYQRMINY